VYTVDDYANRDIAGYPDCTNNSVLEALKQSLVCSQVSPHRVLMVSEAGAAARISCYLNTNAFYCDCREAISVAAGVKIANSALTVIAEIETAIVGEDCLSRVTRENSDITVLVYSYKVMYAAPQTSVLARAVGMGAGFAARGLATMPEQLADLISRAIAYPGLSVIEILGNYPSLDNTSEDFLSDPASCTSPGNVDPDNRQMDFKANCRESAPLGIIHFKDDCDLSVDNTLETLVGQDACQSVLLDIVRQYT